MHCTGLSKMEAMQGRIKALTFTTEKVQRCEKEGDNGTYECGMKEGKKRVHKEKKERTEVYSPFLGNKSVLKHWVFKGIRDSKTS